MDFVKILLAINKFLGLSSYIDKEHVNIDNRIEPSSVVIIAIIEYRYTPYYTALKDKIIINCSHQNNDCCNDPCFSKHTFELIAGTHQETCALT